MPSHAPAHGHVGALAFGPGGLLYCGEGDGAVRAVRPGDRSLVRRHVAGVVQLWSVEALLFGPSGPGRR